MAVSNLLVPHKELQSPSNWGSRNAIAGLIKKGWDKYGEYFKKVSKATNVPVEILVGFSAIESGINPSASSGKTTGMMQWNRDYANSNLATEFKMGRLSDAEKEILKQKGVKWDASGNFQPITASQQLDPLLNILVGAIILGQLSDSIYNGRKEPVMWGVDSNGAYRLDRIVAVYNTGGFSDLGKRARSNYFTSPVHTAREANAVTSAYVKKMYGINGALDVITKEFKDIIV